MLIKCCFWEQLPEVAAIFVSFEIVADPKASERDRERHRQDEENLGAEDPGELDRRRARVRPRRAATAARRRLLAGPTQGWKIRLLSDRIIRIFAHRNSVKILSEEEEIFKKLNLSEILEILRLLNIF